MKETCEREYHSRTPVIVAGMKMMKGLGWKPKSRRVVTIVEYEREMPDPPPSRSDEISTRQSPPPAVHANSVGHTLIEEAEREMPSQPAEQPKTVGELTGCSHPACWATALR